jgi:hypothetical protein
MFPCSHGNISLFYGMRKKGGKFFLKERYFTEGEEVVVLMCSPEVWEQPQAHTPLKCPSSLKRTHSYMNLPYNF